MRPFPLFARPGRPRPRRRTRARGSSASPGRCSCATTPCRGARIASWYLPQRDREPPGGLVQDEALGKAREPVPVSAGGHEQLAVELLLFAERGDVRFAPVAGGWKLVRGSAARRSPRRSKDLRTRPRRAATAPRRSLSVSSTVYGPGSSQAGVRFGEGRGGPEIDGLVRHRLPAVEYSKPCRRAARA